MSDIITDVKQANPNPHGRLKVKVRWKKGGDLTDGEFDEHRGLVYATRGKRPIIVSLHSGEIAWVAPV